MQVARMDAHTHTRMHTNLRGGGQALVGLLELLALHMLVLLEQLLHSGGPADGRDGGLQAPTGGGAATNIGWGSVETSECGSHISCVTHMTHARVMYDTHTVTCHMSHE